MVFIESQNYSKTNYSAAAPAVLPLPKYKINSDAIIRKYLIDDLAL